MRLFKGFALAALAFLSACAPAVAQDHWVASWGAGTAKLSADPIAASGVTYRSIVHMSLGGSKIRLTLSNRFGVTPLVVGGVTVARGDNEGRLRGGAPAEVTFAGSPTITIAPGETIMSDPVDVTVSPLGDLAVSIFLPEQKLEFFTGHALSHQTNYVVSGNHLRRTSLSDPKRTKAWRVVTGIDVLAPAKSGAIVAFGDSITDGAGTTTNANHRWPDLLAARLQADPRYAHLAVVNVGIGGNRLLHAGGAEDGRGGQHQAGVDRWDFDALQRSGVKYIVLLEGINDIGRSSIIREGKGGRRQAESPEEPVTADDLIAAMTRLIDAAHARGIKVIGGTLTPYGGAKYQRPDGEATRQAVNHFIRHGGKFDGVIDFEAAVRDPKNPAVYLPAYNDKDHLHPNDKGTKAMADSVDLSLFE